jgi:Myb-like DNA-binding protein REB1
MATDCRDRYRNHIVNRDKRVSGWSSFSGPILFYNKSLGPWTSAEEEKLTRIVVDMQKGKDLDNDIFWGKVSEMMGGTRTRQQCRIKWTDSLSKKYKADGQNARWSSRDSFILIHKCVVNVF